MFEKSFKFLHALSENNDREWYHAHKEIYAVAKTEFEQFIELLILETSRIDKQIAGLQAKDCIFRIFRDVRFSADKSPYKTNFGAFLVPGGKKSGLGGYYLHLDPAGSFIAGGIHMPEPPVLKAIRSDIFDHIDEFKSILYAPAFRKHYNGISADALKTPPKGFSKDFPDIDLLKFKSFTVMKEKTEKEMRSDVILLEILEAFSALLPFNKFLNEAAKNAS